MEQNFAMMSKNVEDASKESNALKETIGFYKSRRRSLSKIRGDLQELLGNAQRVPHGIRLTHLMVELVNELENRGTQLTETNVTLRTEVETTKVRFAAAEAALRDAQRSHDIDVDDLKRQHRNELESVRQDGKRDLDRAIDEHKEGMRDLKRQLENDLEEERSLRIRELSQISTQGALEKQQGQIEVENKDREIRTMKGDLEQATSDLDRERTLNKELRQSLSTTATNNVTLETTMRALKSKIEYLESDSKSQSQAFGNLQQQLQDAINAAEEAKTKLLKEETLRRKLHNQVQELKGNIRVFCRVRPSLEVDDQASDLARISFPDTATDSKEINIQGPEEKSSLGTITTKTHPFDFDRVFDPTSKNADVFEEISQLVQSALDGYNVCIFCYGQTGSGKTYTMSSDDGMIPLAVRQIYETAQALEEKGWKYRMEGSFVEVYNENLNDLLGKAEEFDKKKHEIRHDVQKCKTTITDVVTVPLDSPDTVSTILKKAASNRSVAATKANERSSRSHSVFILKLCGENSITGEKSEGTLNLVDLAGSERLSHSGATGERLKETQNINRSLSCLGDVIGALGQGKEGGHVPYRNSKVCIHPSLISPQLGEVSRDGDRSLTI
jgi:kinesin family protein C1